MVTQEQPDTAAESTGLPQELFYRSEHWEVQPSALTTGLQVLFQFSQLC